LLSPSDGTGHLSGSVILDEHHPLAGATVQLLCEQGMICLETITDSTGGFALSHLTPRRTLTVRVAQPGFYISEEEYEIQAGFDSAYWITLDQCPNGKCDPSLRRIRTCE
jgi:Carboxypeptidase regulatory-like domain